MTKRKFDFSGYATKVDLKCADGRTIRKDAFKDNDGQTVPLVWQHVHSDPANVLGHALLENREDGVYAYCTFNSTDAGQRAKLLVEHGDITALSIFANQLKQKASDVIHGVIREVSLVLAGANPGALIDNLSIQHSDGSYTESEDEVVIYTGEPLSLTDLKHEDKDTGSATVKDILDTLSEEQRNVVFAMITAALEAGGADDASHSATGNDADTKDKKDGADVKMEDKIEHSAKTEGGAKVKKNVFDKSQEDKAEVTNTLTHAQFAAVMGEAVKNGSLKQTLLAHATEYGIENIDVLFPEAKSVSQPEVLERETGWVPGVLGAIHKSPFSRIKSVFIDMDIDTARAKGYVKATEKKETYFKAAKRITTPTTVYVKQKLDRDDITDVTDFDTVALVRRQLRTLLNEELAVAALIGDGRELDDEFKINEENIRPIWTDDALYTVPELLTTKTDYKKMIKEIAFSGENYKGSGAPVLYTTYTHHVNMLWVEDNNGRRIYESDATLCAALGVSRIVEIPHFVGKTRTVDGKTRELIAIKVNLKDYNFGADKGGEVNTFDDFDIDFNQYKYLMETRCSGALTKAHAAQVYEFEVAAG